MSRQKSQLGFSLIELMVTIGIFTVIMGVVLGNYRSFNKNADFTNAVENIVFALREAQVYGAGGKKAGGTTVCPTGTGTSFNCAYGVYFKNDTKSYITFLDVNDNRAYDTGDTSTEVILPTGISGLIVKCKSLGGSSYVACTNSYASVSFKRPNPDAFISEAPGQVNSIDEVQITISNSTKTAKITMSSAGQISVQ